MQYDVSSSRLQTWSSSKCRNSNRTSQTNCLMDSTAQLSYLPQEFNWCTLTVGVWLLTLFAIPRGRLRSLAWILRSKSKYSDSSKSKSYSPNLWSPVSPTRGANLLPVLPEPQRTRKLHSSRKLQQRLSSLISTKQLPTFSDVATSQVSCFDHVYALTNFPPEESVVPDTGTPNRCTRKAQMNRHHARKGECYGRLRTSCKIIGSWDISL